MSLTPTNVYDNSATPGIAAEVFQPDQLIAGNLKLVTAPVVVSNAVAAVLARGTVMGVVTASGKYIASLPGASDGSQVPSAILADITDVTAGDANAGVYLMGEFNSHAMTYGAWGLAALTAALRSVSIFVKSVAAGLQNIDPT